jgi:hypothetical protein
MCSSTVDFLVKTGISILRRVLWRRFPCRLQQLWVLLTFPRNQVYRCPDPYLGVDFTVLKGSVLKKGGIKSIKILTTNVYELKISRV